MKKYFIFLIIGMFLLTGISTGTSVKNNNDLKDTSASLIHSYVPFQIMKAETETNPINIYYPIRPLQKKADGYDYIILTTDDLLENVEASTFVSWKESIGFSINILSITDTLIQDQPGNDLPAKIRNFLRSYYETWGINYVLIIGSHESIPMRYCYPDPNNHQFNIYNWNIGGEVPTDYYYADLSKPDEESWDSDQDGYYGEFIQDQPDFTAEIYVGRIPTSDPDRISYTLNKITTFEQNTDAWKNNALHAGSMLFYKYEDFQYDIDHDIDGATCLQAIEEDFMQDWTISHLSEQEGISPSIYPWDTLTEPEFTKEWRTGTYAVVNWAGHGSATGVGRTIWDHDNNGNGIPEHANNEIIGEAQINIWSDLEDDYPSIVFAVSCLVGYPEPTGYGNLGIDLLTKESMGAAVAICSASRPAAVSADFTKYHAGAEAYCYEFNHYMIDGPEGLEPVGKALYESKAFVHYNYGWDTWYYEYKNLYNYNLYGDPSMKREGVTDEQPSISIQAPEKGIYINGNKIMPFILPVIIGEINIQTLTSNHIQRVEFYIDNELFQTDYDIPYDLLINEVKSGKHTIKTIAYDSSNRNGDDSLNIWKLF
jgi:hypothetical protein